MVHDPRRRNRTAGQHVDDALRGIDPDPLVRGRGDAADMGGHHQTRLGPEGVVGGGGFLRECVQPRAGNAALAQGGGKGLLVDQAAAAGIDQDRIRPHPGQTLGIDHVA